MPFAHNNLYTGFPFPLPAENHDDQNMIVLTGGANPYNNTLVPASQKLQGKVHKASVSGQLSVATIFSNALQLPGFPRSSFAIIQSGQLGLTFAQIDLISKRLGLIISSLVISPGSEYQVSSNSDGDSVVMLVLEDEHYIDEQMVVLIVAILRLGATYMVVNKKDISTDTKSWKQLMTLIEPILVITLGDPLDLPTAMKTDLNLMSREHFEDFQEEEEVNSENLAECKSESSTDVANPMAASFSLVKKIRSSLILKPSTYNPAAISCKVIWDLSMDLKIQNEGDFHLIPFRSDVMVGQRTAFIFRCSPQYWCRLGHKAIRNRISWERMEFPIKNNEKICLTFPLQDPRSLVQIFNCFVHGKVLILGEPGEFYNGGFFLRKIRSESFRNVQRIELTPERLKELLDTATQTGMESHLSNIKMWMVSGSHFPSSLAKYFFQVVRSINEDVKLVTTYGKAECLWCATWNEFTSLSEVSKNVVQEKGRRSKLSVGTPVTNTTVFIVDEGKSQFCSVGQKGSIYVAGSMVPYSGYCGAPVLGRCNILFQTGELGRFLQNKRGNLRLFVESDVESPVMLKGKLIDLEDFTRQLMQHPWVKECYTFVCRRGRDDPEIVVAVAPKEPTAVSQLQKMIEKQECPLPVTTLPMTTIPKLHDGQTDMRQLRASYFKYMGRSSSKQWLSLMPSRTPMPKSKSSKSINNNNDEIVFEKCVQVICKAVAFSMGRPITEIIENFEKNFWSVGGTPLRAIMTVKSCLCQGKKLTLEDFIDAKTISELGCRLAMAEKDDVKWSESNAFIRQSFIYSRMTRSDQKDLYEILVENFSKMFVMDQKGAEKYATTLVDVFDNTLSAVALTTSEREIVGAAFTYKGALRSHYIPQKLEEGFELYNSVIQSCKHLTKGIESRYIAKTYLISMRTSPVPSSGKVLSSPQVMLLTRDLLKESMKHAVSVSCKAFLLCTVDSLVQEICCSLLGFETLSEIQLNTYKNKKLQKPFIHCDDHQVIGVYFKRLSDHHHN